MTNISTNSTNDSSTVSFEIDLTKAITLDLPETDFSKVVTITTN